MRRPEKPIFAAAWGFILFCAVCAAPSATHRADTATPTDGNKDGRVDALLARTDRPADDEEWKQLGPSVLETLEHIYESSADSQRRIRAIEAIGKIDATRAAATLRRLWTDRKVEIPYRIAALAALCHRVGPAAVEEIKPSLVEADPLMREAGARALAILGTPEARAALEDRLTKEDVPAVRATIQQGLAKIEP